MDEQPPLRRFFCLSTGNDAIDDLRGVEIWRQMTETSLGTILCKVSASEWPDFPVDIAFVLGARESEFVDFLDQSPGRVIVDVWGDLDFEGWANYRDVFVRLIKRAECVTAGPTANMAQLLDINPNVVALPDVHDDQESQEAYMRALTLALVICTSVSTERRKATASS